MKTKHTRPQTVLELICILLLVAQLVYAFWMWLHLPAHIPAHFNLAGQVDRIGSKNELFFMPAATVAMYAFLTLMQRFAPSAVNMPVEKSRYNQAYLETVGRVILIASKLCVESTFFIITIIFAAGQVAYVWTSFLPVAGLFAFLIPYTIHIRRRADKITKENEL